MNILDIEFIGNTASIPSSLFDNMLSAGIMDDYIFEKAYFSIKMEKTPADLVNYMYRLLWEYVYIKTSFPSNIKVSFIEDIIEIHITLSEAIAFIKASLPKNFRHAIKSIEDITTNLKVSLASKSSTSMTSSLVSATHYPLFKDTINFKPFNTVEPQLVLAEKFKHLSDTKVGKIMVMSSSGEFKQIFDSQSLLPPAIFGIIEIHTDKLSELFKSCLLEDIVICNVTLNGYIMHIKFYKHSVSPRLQSYIKESYQNILK